MTKRILTQDELKSILNYDKDTGIFTWKVRKANRTKIGSIAGCIDKKGYIMIMLDDKSYSSHRLAWLYMTGEMPKYQIDHINNIKHDNRISNLRDVTNAENQRNQHKAQKNNKLGHRNISWNKRWNKFIVRMYVNGMPKYFGQFNDIDSAKSKAEEVRMKFNNIGIA